MSDLFDRCVKKSCRGGKTSISCRLGLWGVEGRDVDQVEKEARHYWIQYYKDGEYAKLLKESANDTNK